jgi:hypothetical protein
MSEKTTTGEVPGSVTIVREFFATPDKPVTMKEMRELGVSGIKELAEEIKKQAEA